MMQPLDKALRSKLERTVREARDIAEAAARASLEQLGVGEINHYAHLNEDERKLRVRLRAHGRQLGDAREPDGKQEILRLIEEVAYEHWHRMLFARFLAENSLLMYPDPVDPVPITLEECEDLAAGEGAKNGWELAARFAARMLPQIFRPDSPVFQLVLPPEHQQRLEGLLAELPVEVFFASDSLGWVYQFWQTKKKEEINASEVKIGARELPVVTQLFTEPYMVSFLLDNSLGAWWAARRLSEEDLLNSQSEEELRRKASLPGVPLDYLRFVRGEDGRWAPAAGTFDGWPESLKELKVLDPCCGSGHFLVAALPMLASMRSEREGLYTQEAVDCVLQDNLHGLEIDPRCVELAAFALGFAAWRYPGAGGYRTLPEMNLACSGLAIAAKKEEWLKLAGEDSNLQIVLDDLYDQFEKAPILGSLINPKTGLSRGNLLGLKWKDVAPLLVKAVSRGDLDDEKMEMGVVARGLSKAAALMARQYQLVITNVPYLARGRQNDFLKKFGQEHYPDSRRDLATIFLDRCFIYCADCGSVSLVLPQNWLFLTSYKNFRERLLKHNDWQMIARLGAQAFETPMWDFNVQLFLIKKNITHSKVLEFPPTPENCHMIVVVDVSDLPDANEKAAILHTIELNQVGQVQQLKNPDARVIFKSGISGEYLSKYAYSSHGLTTGDTPRMKMAFWEIVKTNNIWIPFQGTVEKSCMFGGNENLLRWHNGHGPIDEIIGARKFATEAWGKKGVLVSQMHELHVTLYRTFGFDNNTAVIVPLNPDYLPPIWCFCSSPEYNKSVRCIDQKLSVTSATLAKVPFDFEYWQKVAAERYPEGLPKPYSDDPTQWIFHGHPAQSDAPLQVAVARLLGYRWPAELDPEMELSDEARAWVKRCDELLRYADDDGIVCIPPVRGESAAADDLLNMLAAAYGQDWSTDKLNELLKQADHAGKSLESWLRDKFFLQHCRLFHHRPFIWHIWDGLYDGFTALVNYHKLDAKLLESLIYTYLGDWITRQKDDIQNGVDGAEERLAAAEGLKKRLELILEGEEPYDIFVRWKPLEEQPVGWNPDLNDGVRLNIRPFMSVPDVGKKGAGVLREKPNIKWNKDRGKDVQSAPWYHRFGGDRINDYHLRLAEKRDAKSSSINGGK